MAIIYATRRDSTGQEMYDVVMMFADNASALQTLQESLGEEVMDGSVVHYANTSGWEVHQGEGDVLRMSAAYEPDFDALTGGSVVAYVNPYSSERVDARVNCTCPPSEEEHRGFRCFGHVGSIKNDESGDWRHRISRGLDLKK